MPTQPSRAVGPAITITMSIPCANSRMNPYLTSTSFGVSMTPRYSATAAISVAVFALSVVGCLPEPGVWINDAGSDDVTQPDATTSTGGGASGSSHAGGAGGVAESTGGYAGFEDPAGGGTGGGSVGHGGAAGGTGGGAGSGGVDSSDGGTDASTGGSSTGGGPVGGSGGSPPDPCASITCSPHATCVVNNSVAACTCVWPYYGKPDNCQPPSSRNWDFEDWSHSDPPIDFTKSHEDRFVLSKETAIVNTGAAACSVKWSTVDNRDIETAWYTPISPNTEYSVHMWVHDNDPNGRLRAMLLFTEDPAVKPEMQFSGKYSTNSTEWQNLVFTSRSAADSKFVRAGARFYDQNSDTFVSATVVVDDFDITQHQAFDVGDGQVDTLQGSPASPPQLATTPLELYTAINDAATLYVASTRVTKGKGDRAVFVWFGSPNPVESVVLPWNKNATIAGPSANGILIALMQEEENGYCEFLYMKPSSAVWAMAESYQGACSTKVTKGKFVEGFFNVATVLKTTLAALPATLHAVALELETADFGLIVPSLQTPRVVREDSYIAPDETIGTHRAKLLVGSLR